MPFLPITKKEMKAMGLSQMDFVYICGDAYVDHSSFGMAIITRVLEAHGFSVGIIAQPDWKDDNSITVFGEPRLGFLVSAGNMDSMVNHYTVSKKHRSIDAYSPGGKMGLRPDRAVIVYGNLIRKTYKHTPIILGGIEASLRRLAHYDYWSDSVRRSVLLDSGADLISYGMGEHSIVEIAEALDSGLSVDSLTFIPGTVYKSKTLDHIENPVMLPSYPRIKESKMEFAESFRIQHENTDPVTGQTLVEDYENQMYVIANPPAQYLTTQEMDDIYDLPYMRNWHPVYDKDGGIPALDEIRFSLTSNRGCFGGCNFCALTFHQGRTVQVRSHESLIAEAREMTNDAAFKGYIHDVGGPTADFRGPSCQKQISKGVCKNKQCLFPKPCGNLKADHTDYVKLLRKLRELPKVKKVFIRSGIRFDYVNADKDNTFLHELVEHHISGQLRVAPEHVSDKVLGRMGKPDHASYQKFIQDFNNCNKKTGKKQYALPYFMSSHPGCELSDAVMLAEYIRDMGFIPEQAQDFYPTPSTMSTCMYYTGIDPVSKERVYVAKNPHEKAMQRALIQYRNPNNYDLVKEALLITGRTDLIGFDKNCLIRPRGGEKSKNTSTSKSGNEKSGKFKSGSKSGYKPGNKSGNKSTADDAQKKRKPIRNLHKKKS